MSLDAKILGLDQKVDFSDGSISNVVRIELPNGTQVVALVTDEGAQHVLAAVQAARGVFKKPSAPAVPPPTTRVVYAPRPAATQPMFEFDGGEAEEPPDEEEDEAVVGPQLGPQLTRVRTPPADEKGNPVDASGRPLYEHEATPPEEAATDEDGVKSL
jgi:hypothetical protein